MPEKKRADSLFLFPTPATLAASRFCCLRLTISGGTGEVLIEIYGWCLIEKKVIRCIGESSQGRAGNSGIPSPLKGWNGCWRACIGLRV